MLLFFIFAALGVELFGDLGKFSTDIALPEAGGNSYIEGECERALV